MFYSLVSLNAANGAILWSTSPLNLSSVQDPVLHPNGLILVNGLANLTSSSLVAFNASGNISWIFTYNTNSVFSIVCGRGIQGHIYVLGYENSSFSLLAIEPEAGTLLWKKGIVASILRLTFVREDDILVLTNSTATILIEPVNGNIVGAVNDFISLALGNNNSIFGISNENVMKYSSDFTLIWTFKPSFLFYITYSSITFDSDGLLYFTALTYSGTVTIAINDTTGNASWRFSYHTVSSSFRPVVT